MSREIKQITTTLRNFEISHDTASVREALRRLLVLGNDGCEIGVALPLVIKVLPAHDIILKKLSCLLLIMYGYKMPEIVLMTHNTIRQEFQDPNPLVRSMTLKTACQLRSENFENILSTGLNDESPQVRRAAVLSCARVNKHQDPTWLAEVVENMYEKLRDDDPLVVSNCLVALEELLKAERGVAVNRNIFNHLLNQINNFTESGQMFVLRILRRYKPKTEPELFDVLNCLDPLFISPSCAVVVENFRFFKLLLSENYPHLVKNAAERVGESFKRFLSDQNPELTYLILDVIQNEILNVENNLQEHNMDDIFRCLLPSLLCKYGETACCKVKKMQILCNFVNNDNFLSVFQDVCVNLTDYDAKLSSAAVSALGKMADKLNAELFQICVAKLFQILDCSRHQLVSESLWILQQIDLHRLPDKSILIDHFQRMSYDSLTDDDSKCSFLHILGEYGELITRAPYILESIVMTNYWNGGEISLDLGCVLLTCTLKLFFKRPAECQTILGRTFETCFNHGCHELQHEVAYYYTLLKNDISLCKRCVGCEENVL